MDKPTVTVRIDEHGGLAAVEIEGHVAPTDLEETAPGAPLAPFRDEEYREKPRPWLVG